jgi:hypothetical protein
MRAWLLEQGFEPRPRDRQGSPSAGPRRPHMGPPRDGQPPRRRPGGPPTSGHPHPNAPPDQPSAGGTPTPE